MFIGSSAAVVYIKELQTTIQQLRTKPQNGDGASEVWVRDGFWLVWLTRQAWFDVNTDSSTCTSSATHLSVPSSSELFELWICHPQHIWQFSSHLISLLSSLSIHWMMLHFLPPLRSTFATCILAQFQWFPSCIAQVPMNLEFNFPVISVMAFGFIDEPFSIVGCTKVVCIHRCSGGEQGIIIWLMQS